MRPVTLKPEICQRGIPNGERLQPEEKKKSEFPSDSESCDVCKNRTLRQLSSGGEQAYTVTRILEGIYTSAKTGTIYNFD